MQFTDDIDERPTACPMAATQNAQNAQRPAKAEDEDEHIGEKTAVQAVTRFSSFAERRRKAEALLHQNPDYRWTLYHVLEKCNDGAVHPLAELEAFVAAQPDFAGPHHAPYFPIAWLEQSFALEECYLDADGRVYTWDDVEPLTEDQFDDLVAQYAYRTTEVGADMLEQFAPQNAIRMLMGESGSRRDIYLDLLRFARTPRNPGELDWHVRTSDAFATERALNDKITPVAFLDKLAGAGGLTFDNGWRTTKEGEDLLEQMEEE